MSEAIPEAMLQEARQRRDRFRADEHALQAWHVDLQARIAAFAAKCEREGIPESESRDCGALQTEVCEFIAAVEGPL
jgi:hypothetical protein